MYFDRGVFRIGPFKPLIDVFLGVKTLFHPYFTEKDVWIDEEDDTVIIKVVLPGFKKEYIEIRADEEEIYVKAEKPAVDEFEKHYWRRYLENGKIVIKWRISMPITIEPNSGKAKMEAGILTIKFRKKVKGEKVPVD